MALLLRFHVSQTNMLRINSKCCSPCCVSTQPTPGCVTWRRQRPETERSAHHTPATHGAPTKLYPHGRYRTAPRTPRSSLTGLGYPWYSRPAVIHDCARLEPARNREPTPQQAHSEKAGPPCVAELRSTHMLNRPVRGDIPERWVCGHGRRRRAMQHELHEYLHPWIPSRTRDFRLCQKTSLSVGRSLQRLSERLEARSTD